MKNTDVDEVKALSSFCRRAGSRMQAEITCRGRNAYIETALSQFGNPPLPTSTRAGRI